MALYLPDGSLHIGTEYDDLAKRITYGDGVGWSGDPRLYLQVGVMEARDPVTGYTRTGRRLEVWRWNEDGSETMVGHWRPDEQFQILKDLAEMKAGAEARTSVEARIDAHNKTLEDKASAQFRDSMGAL